MLPVEAIDATANTLMQGAQLVAYGTVQHASAVQAAPNTLGMGNVPPPTYAPPPNMQGVTDGYMQHMAAAEREFFAKQIAQSPVANAPQLLELALELPPHHRPWYQRAQVTQPHQMREAAPMYNAVQHWSNTQQDHVQLPPARTARLPATLAAHQQEQAPSRLSQTEGGRRVADPMDVDFPHAPSPAVSHGLPSAPRDAALLHPFPATSRDSSIAHALGPLPHYPPTPAPPYTQTPPMSMATMGLAMAATATMAPPLSAPATAPQAPQVAQAAPQLGGEQSAPAMLNNDVVEDPLPSPTYTMYGSMKFLDKPAGGWPKKYGQGFESIFRGLARSKREVWRRFKPDTELLIQLGAQTDFFREAAFLKAAKALVHRFVGAVTGETAFVIISPEKDMENSQDGVFPALYFAYRLTREGIARARARLVWHSEDGTFHIPETYTGASPYIGTYRGFGHIDHDTIKEAAVTCFANAERIDNLAKILSDDDGAQQGTNYRDLALEVIGGIEVSVYRELREDKEEGPIVASVYCNPPVSDAYQGAWYLWTRSLTTVVISSAYIDGSGTHVTAKQCASCHGGDHDFWNCPFRTIPGFHGTLRLDVSKHGANWSTEAPGRTAAQSQDEASPHGPRVVYYHPDTRPTRNSQPRPRSQAPVQRRQEWIEDTRYNGRQQQWNPPQHYPYNAHAGPSRAPRANDYDLDEEVAYRTAHHRGSFEGNRGHNAQSQQTRPHHRSRRAQKQPERDYPPPTTSQIA